jgi:hypothetical protein
VALVEATPGSQRSGKREARAAGVNAIIDPVNGVAMCGICGELQVDVVHAYECCVVGSDPPAWRAALALALVVASIVFLLALPVIYR